MKRLVQLLKPEVSAEAKLTGVSLFIGKWLDVLDRRLSAIEKAPPVVKTVMMPPPPGGNTTSNVVVDAIDRRISKLEMQAQERIPKVVPLPAEIVEEASVEIDGHLIIRMSSGRIIDAGKIESPANKVIATSTNKDQIILSSTAPSNPQLNDLWIQT
jgi:hypothetical protein